MKVEPKDKPIQPLKGARAVVITPKRIVLIVFIIFLVLVGLYFYWQIGFLTRAPELEVSQPPTDITTIQATFEIIGKTIPNAYLTVNNQEVYIDKEGNFKTEIELSEGVNIVKVEVKNRFNKTNEIIRRIIYERK